MLEAAGPPPIVRSRVMKFVRPTAFGILLSLMVSVVAAATSPTQAIAAAMKLSEVASYSWTARIFDNAGSYEIAGKTAKGGLTVVVMPIPSQLASKLSDRASDRLLAVFHGSRTCVLKTNEGWAKPPALQEPLLGGRFDGDNYSNLQLSLCHPHEELGIIVASHVEMKPDGDAISGTLTEAGAAMLLVHDGRPDVTAVGAAGTFKLWVKEGVVVRYDVELVGTLTALGRGGRNTVEVRQKMSVRLSDIGITKVVVPAEAIRAFAQ